MQAKRWQLKSLVCMKLAVYLSIRCAVLLDCSATGWHAIHDSCHYLHTQYSDSEVNTSWINSQYFGCFISDFNSSERSPSQTNTCAGGGTIPTAGCCAGAGAGTPVAAGAPPACAVRCLSKRSYRMNTLFSSSFILSNSPAEMRNEIQPTEGFKHLSSHHLTTTTNLNNVHPSTLHAAPTLVCNKVHTTHLKHFSHLYSYQ